MGSMRSVVLATLILGGVLGGSAEPAHAGDELHQLLNALSGASGRDERIDLVRRLGRFKSKRAAAQIARVIRLDPDEKVRLAAAKTLGRIDSEPATDHLWELLVHGNVRSVRESVTRSLLKRDGGLERILTRLEEKQDVPVLERGLLLHALALAPDLRAVETLEWWTKVKNRHARTEALRALAKHPIGAELVPNLLVTTLRKHQDLDTVMTGLDLAVDLADSDFRPVADIISSFLQPEVSRAVEAARERLDYLDALAAFEAKKGSTYSQPTPPEPPPPRPRLDVVYVFDATGSVVGHLDLIQEKIRSEATTLERVGTDLRVACVAFRDNERRSSKWVTNSHPLTSDVELMLNYMRAIDSGGTDARGASIAVGLEQSMNRMTWRSRARCQVILIADSKASDRDRAVAVTGVHRRADSVRTSIWYLLRTRAKMPPEMQDLARVGGGSVKVLQ